MWTLATFIHVEPKSVVVTRDHNMLPPMTYHIFFYKFQEFYESKN
jgi:hypothetical protein